MFDGNCKPVEQIVIGDFLMGPDSTPRLVTSICHGVDELYRVTPTRGDAYVVNSDHILSLRITNCKHSVQCGGDKFYAGDIADVTIGAYLDSNKTFKHVAKGYRAGVDFSYPPAQSILTPYILGVWLGDGSSRSPEIANVDAEVISEWSRYAESIGHVMRVSTSPERIAVYRISGPDELSLGRGHHRNSVFNELRRLDLLLNKHIPHAFKVAPRSERLELLAGVIDTDGFFNNGVYDLVFKQEALAFDVAFIARSLGLASYVAPCQKTCANTGAVGSYFRVSISGHLDQVPCRVPRRKAGPREQKKDVLMVGIKVEPIGRGDYYGFELAGNDRRFLLGDFTVTHNTVIFSDELRDTEGASVAIAHRQELVGQMALALSRDEVRFRVIGPQNVIRDIVQTEMEELGRSYYHPNAQCAAAGVDTLVSWARPDSPHYHELMGWAPRVRKWVQDEAHHLLDANKWGKAIQLFPNAVGLGVTATPERADGRGLGRHHDGVFDTMVTGPSMRDLIDGLPDWNGNRTRYLTDYRVIVYQSKDFKIDSVATGADGDYIRKQLATQTRDSSVMGDVIDGYLRFARGKLGVTFAPDVETASELAVRFQQAGVPAEVLSAKTPSNVRRDVLRRFRRREILQLVNVDLFGEGFDLPAIEVVSMARATQSYALYAQQFGRALRLLEGKLKAIIIDHVGNVIRHGGPPDRPRVWSMDRRERKAKTEDDGTVPWRNCLNPECMAPYERTEPCCPYCGWVPVPAERSAVEFIDGDPYELDGEVLRAMYDEIERANEHPDAVRSRLQNAGQPFMNAKHVANLHAERLNSLAALRDQIAWWAGFRRAAGQPDAKSYREFFYKFGIDVLTAQTLKRAEAEALTQRIYADIQRGAAQ